MATDFADDEVGSGQAAVLSLFEDREPAKVGVREENAAMRLGKVAPLGGEDCPDHRAGHGMPDSHNVDARNALPDVSVHSLQVVQDRFFPVIPILI
jgi:hypothetical protein